MAITSLADVLWFWDAIMGLQPVIGGDATFARNSSALVISDRAYRVRSVPAAYPRFPWVSVGGDRLPALLLEPARTDIALQSQALNLSPWGVSRVAVTANAAVAPDGTLTADKIVETATTGSHIIFQSVTITAGGSHAVTIFASPAERDWIVLRSVDGGIGFEAYFDLASGAKGTLRTVGSGATATRHEIEHIGHGIYRCTIVGKKQAGDTTTDLQVGPATGDLGLGYTGDGSSGIHLWGAHFEDNVDYATSYPGEVAGSPVPRAVESMSWNNAPAPQAMVIYVDLVMVAVPVASDFGEIVNIGKVDGSAAKLSLRHNGADALAFVHHNGTASSTASCSLTSPVPGDRLQAVAVVNADGSGRFVVSHNGADVSSAALAAPTGGLPTSWSDNVLSLNSTGSTNVNAHEYRQVKIASPANLDSAVDGSEDQALLDELAALTVNQFGTVRAA